MKVRLHLPIGVIQPIAGLRLLSEQFKCCSKLALGFSTLLSPHVSVSRLHIKVVHEDCQIVYKLIPIRVCEYLLLGVNWRV